MDVWIFGYKVSWLWRLNCNSYHKETLTLSEQLVENVLNPNACYYLVGCRLWGCTASDTTEWDLAAAAAVCFERRRQWQPTPVLLPGKSHGWRNLVGCSPWGREELDTTELLPFHFSLSCIGEGNGNPLQYSCLKNPRDGGAWWAVVYGVTQSQTWLKRLSISSSVVGRLWDNVRNLQVKE